MTKRSRFCLLLLLGYSCVWGGCSDSGHAPDGRDPGTTQDFGREDDRVIPDTTDLTDTAALPDAGDLTDTAVQPDATDQADTTMPPDAMDQTDIAVPPDVGDLTDTAVPPDALDWLPFPELPSDVDRPDKFDLAEDADLPDEVDLSDATDSLEPEDLLDVADLPDEVDLPEDADSLESEDPVDTSDWLEPDESSDQDVPLDTEEEGDIPPDIEDASAENDFEDTEDFDGEGGVGLELVVNSLEDLEEPPEGVVTLRSALRDAASGQPIRFDAGLDGGTIGLSIVGEEHTILLGEVMGMRMEPSGPVSYLVGYFERDYGRSALYAVKNVVIDASSLPSGITLAWTGGAASPARVLAVYGDLDLTNVTITGGHSVAEEIPGADPDEQPWTLARGGGVAVWGEARLVDCTLHDNHCVGDYDSSRDRGSYGGGIYAHIVDMDRCVVGGNTILGSGAAGGGVFSVGGVESDGITSTIVNSSITGNRISAFMSYGGGVYSDGGGIGRANSLSLTNCTIARNVAESHPGYGPYPQSLFGYWRGGGIYMSNGYLRLRSCTVVENEVYGYPRIGALGKPNLAGGIAATIGNAHAVEKMVISHSIVAGNTVFELGMNGQPSGSYAHDIFTGSLLHFESLGYNRFGVIDFSQILVPVGQRLWRSLCRRHYPKVDDQDGVDLADVVNLDSGITFSDTILSAGVDPPSPVPLYYEPQGTALDRITATTYLVNRINADYRIAHGFTNDFLAIMLGRIEDHYGLEGFAVEFTASFEAFLQSVDLDEDTPGAQPYTDPDGNPILTLADTQWFGPAEIWPRQLYNYPYIEFWHRLDEALAAESIAGMGPELLDDAAWSSLFESGPLVENPGITIFMYSLNSVAELVEVDQLGEIRPAGTLGDIGAIELP